MDMHGRHDKTGLRLGIAVLTAVFSFQTTASAQCQIQKLTGAGANLCEQFGKATDIDGTRLVIGAHAAEDDPVIPCASGPGGAYVFDLVGTEWVQTQRLSPSDGGEGDEFGNNVGVSGDRIIVGSEHHNGAVGSNSGAAYIYELQGAMWVEVAKLAPSDSVKSQYFGRSVSIAGDLAVIGTRFDKDNGNQAGAAYVFKRDAFGNWNEVQKLKASDGGIKDLFGNSVSTDGTRIVSGAYFKDGAAGSKAGAAYVYELQGSTWLETAKLEASDQAANAEFSRSVSIDGPHIVIGARIDVGSGSAYVYELQGANWVETDKLLPSNGHIFAKFGESVDIDGNKLVVGARRIEPPQGGGAVYLFEKQNGNWTETAYFRPFDVVQGQNFGYDCALSGDIVLGGGPYDLNNQGSAAIFSMSGICEDTLLGSPSTISLSAGGSHTLKLQGGSSKAGDHYWVFGSVLGTSPGTTFLSGITLPLNFGPYFNLTLTKPFLGIFTAFFDRLDSDGNATAAFSLPPGTDPSLAGITFWHAFVSSPTLGTVTFASNAVSVMTVP